jgi:hypothetical protein
MSRLSAELLRHHQELDQDYLEDLPAEERRKAEETQRIAALIVAKLVQARTTLKPRNRQALELLDDMDRAFLERSFDSYWTRTLLRAVPKIARRTAELAPLCVDVTPDKRVNVYLREASRSYVFGLWQASVASARAAIEVALSQVLEDAIGRISERAMLSELVTLATQARTGRVRILDRAHAEKARQVLRVGNGALHRRPVNSKEALDTLRKASDVLMHLYRGE